MSAKAGKRPMRPLSNSAKLDAIRRVHDGESKASVARDIGVPESTLRGWCKNEQKIIQLLRKSNSPNSTGSVSSEHQDKKPRIDENMQPFNLSLKSTTSPNTVSTPYVDFPKMETDDVPLDLQHKSSYNMKDTSVNYNNNNSNKAKLARLSVQFGLDKPEKFVSSPPNVNQTDLSNLQLLTAHWNSLIQTQIHQKPLGSSCNEVSFLNSVKEEAKLPNERIPTEDSVRYWLNNSTPPKMSQDSVSFPISLSTPKTKNNGNSVSPVAAITPEHTAWVMNWYNSVMAQHYAANTQNPVNMSIKNTEKPILYQQLTKIKEEPNAGNEWIASLPEYRPESKNIRNTKARAVLDTLLFNNNNITSSRDKDEELYSQTEAVINGQKFLTWLESCSEPSVTSMQIMQFRTLLGNVKASIDRKNGEYTKQAKRTRK